MSISRVLLAVSALALVLSGCRGCDGPAKTNLSSGEIRIVYEQGGVVLEGDTGTYDFGQVAMGKTVTRKLIVKNGGRGSLFLDAFEKVDGDAVQLGTQVVEVNPVFGLDFPGNVEVPSGEQAEFDLTFTPPLNDTEKQVAHLAHILLRASNTGDQPPTANITLMGNAVSGECEIQSPVDFGAVARGDSFQQSRTLENTRPIDTLAYVGDISSAQGESVFSFTPDSPRGEFILASNKAKTVTFVFSPTEARDYFATVTMRAADGCPDVKVRLMGTGVDAVLTWTPALVDFGYVQPGQEVASSVTFENKAMREVELTALQPYEGATPSVVYEVTEANAGDPTKLTVPAATRDPITNELVAGSAVVKMSFKPVVLGPRQGVLRASADLQNQSSIAVPLRGVGGGPDIDVRPSPTLNFGRIAYFTGTPAAYGTRKIVVQNVGTRPSSPDPRANLRLGMGGAGAPYWSVRAVSANADVSELCVGVFDTVTSTCTDTLPTTTYDPAVGIEASGTNALLDVPVRVTPNGLGQKEWEITFYSNDPDEPEVKVSVQANAVELLPCNYTVTPLNLAFGVVTPPGTRDLGFQVKNEGTNPTDICLVTNLDMKAGSDPIFTLPGGPVNEKELQPGETWNVLVRAWPQGQLPPNATLVTGQVLFNMSNQTRPEVTVNLNATLAPSCLIVAPNDLDFGTVQKDCNSTNRSFQMYNACSTSITVTQFSMLQAAGEPAGGPNCPGASPCPEFHQVSTPVIPGTGLVLPPAGTPLQFQLKYHPINYGSDTGAFLIKVTQSGQLVDYIVTLRGSGDTMGLNTDTFHQDSQPRADILLVVDNSCSMSDKQMALGSNLTSFLKFATSSSVDFQIGVTTTDDDLGGEQGDLVASSMGTKIFKPTTPNLDAQFASAVNVGTNGSGTELCYSPAVKALTAPKITDPSKNLGLLRQDAVLAVVCVSDETEQSPQPVSYYINQLLNIKGAQRPGLFTLNAIAGFTAGGGCATLDDGRYAVGVSLTQGVKEDICTPDWAKALENIGKKAFGFRTTFFLTATPDLSGTNTVQVAIDGVPLPPTDSRGAKVWEYDSVNNAVEFEPLYVPEPGKTMTVTYVVACL